MGAQRTCSWNSSPGLSHARHQPAVTAGSVQSSAPAQPRHAAKVAGSNCMTCITGQLDELLLLPLPSTHQSFSQKKKEIQTKRVLLSPAAKLWEWCFNSLTRAELRCLQSGVEHATQASLPGNADKHFMHHPPPMMEFLSWKGSCEDQLVNICEVQILLH